MPQRVSGRVSWFGGPNDSGDPSGRTATGTSNAAPGIAVYNRSTLGGYWRVTLNGKTSVLKQTDIGPAPWTGKKVDVTTGAIGRFGFNERNFPTGAKVTAEYLGKRKPSSADVSQALSQPSSQPSQPSSPSASSEQKRALLNALVAKRNPNSMLIRLGVV